MAERSLFFFGGVKIAIRGQNIERFLNIAAQRELVIHHIAEESDGTVTCFTTPNDFRRMKPAARKTGVKLRILSRYGLPFILYKNRTRKLLVGGIAAFFLLLYTMSFFIWDISFEGNRQFTDEMILHYMETIPVVHGMKKSDISCEQLEAGIRNQFTEITWVSAEMKGTRLVVRIKENEALLAPILMENSPCDLSAEKAGTIVRTVVRSGFCQVKEGDVVEAGDLLVDGTIPIYDDSAALVNSHEVHADAEIYAQTVHTIQKTIPFTETVTSRTGTCRNGAFIKMFDRVFYLMPPAASETSWQYVMEQSQIKLLENFYLPIYIGSLRAYEYLTYEKNYTEMEITEVYDAYLQEYMEKLQEKGIQILGSDGKIEHSESGWQITGTLTVIENIAMETPVTVAEEEFSEVQ